MIGQRQNAVKIGRKVFVMPAFPTPDGAGCGGVPAVAV
jgi:hypothetical protein